ncbi:hypothetical protein K7432_014222 [Basidiobolus ranarum]|uniref:Uncharacterized protein n=1 Tax=Basidiobolus ranarum TaxID=34480 RepID=A0ABR2WHX8_9FUNG
MGLGGIGKKEELMEEHPYQPSVPVSIRFDSAQQQSEQAAETFDQNSNLVGNAISSDFITFKESMLIGV